MASRKMTLSDDELEISLAGFMSNASSDDVGKLLRVMNDYKIIGWDEAQKIVDEAQDAIVKCGLPEEELMRVETGNTTNVDYCIRQLTANDETMTEVNINNMKDIPLPQIKKLILSIRENTFIQKLSMSNANITDDAAAPLLEALQSNTSLRVLNMETNFLSGEFLTSLFGALLKKQTVEEVRVANQAVAMSNQAEIDVAKAINANQALRRVGLDLRRREARNMVDRALYRNSEKQRLLRVGSKVEVAKE